jgi:hypothetical protein
MCASVVKNLTQWRDDILAAGPRHVTPDHGPDLVLVLDASDWGWGALSIDDLGRDTFVSAQWTSSDRRTFDTGSSVRAEPEGIYRACCRFVRTGHHRAVHIATDSSASKGALGKGHSRSYWMNHVCLRLQATFPDVVFTFEHIPGAANPADRISRGAAAPTADEIDSARQIADRAQAARGAGEKE